MLCITLSLSLYLSLLSLSFSISLSFILPQRVSITHKKNQTIVESFSHSEDVCVKTRAGCKGSWNYAQGFEGGVEDGGGSWSLAGVSGILIFSFKRRRRGGSPPASSPWSRRRLRYITMLCFPTNQWASHSLALWDLSLSPWRVLFSQFLFFWVGGGLGFGLLFFLSFF